MREWEIYNTQNLPDYDMRRRMYYTVQIHVVPSMSLAKSKIICVHTCNLYGVHH